MTRIRVIWALLVAALYAVHAVGGVREQHAMKAGPVVDYFWRPLPGGSSELLAYRVVSVVGLVLLLAGALPPLRPARFEAAFIATALPAGAVIPLLVGPLGLGHRLDGFAEPRDTELMHGIIVLDALIAIAALVVVVAEAVGVREPEPAQDS